MCCAFGYSKQAYYRSQHNGDKLERECYVASLVEDLREDMPRLGGIKLWKLLNDNGVRVGRDDLYNLLRTQGLLVKGKKRHIVTTDSRGWQRQYPSMVKGLEINRPNQVWVSNISYVLCRSGFVYLSLVTDTYSRCIMGYHVHERLDTGDPLRDTGRIAL